ncbi:transporter substrate-binding domain-containing protein [Oryzomonas japonica]|uniref:histidine kinase n=2 Tax=Oryzomonas japonica TaxID=2603858 RepID=A0A7J4ZLQ7_9BACT|nr:transporter substrate-binding domain-containing protein [Oryzomonas japonica]
MLATMNRMKTRMTLIVLTAAALSMAVAACAEDFTPPPVASDTIIAAIPPDFPPTYSQNRQTGKPVGFAVDVMNEIARRAGLKVVYVFGQQWDEVEHLVLSGKADLVPNLLVDDARSKLFTFTEPVESVPVHLTVRSHESRFYGIIPGIKIGVIKESVGEHYLKGIPAITIITYPNLHSLIFELLSGQIDAALTATPNITKLANEAGVGDKIKTVGEPVIDGKRAMALRKGNLVLAARLNKAIEGFVGSPEYQALYRKWWGTPEPYWNARRVTGTIGATLALAVLLMGGWRYYSIKRLNAQLTESMAKLENAQKTLQEQAALLEEEIAERHLAEVNLAVKQQQLEEVNRSLEDHIATTLKELREKDQMLIQQGRFAAMGEMISNISHQWRQPLNNVGLIIQNLQEMSEHGELNPEILNHEVKVAMDVILFMSNTIDDFRFFFRPDKEKSEFIVNKVIEKTIKFMSPALRNYGITIAFDAEPNVCIVGYPNEYSQMLINIINNAKDVLLERKILKPRITIRVFRDNALAVATIADNAGGIDADVLPKVFDPYFTTKEPGKGTGIGLYMSKVIAEKNMEGRLIARNLADGAEFRIEMPLRGPLQVAAHGGAFQPAS